MPCAWYYLRTQHRARTLGAEFSGEAGACQALLRIRTMGSELHASAQMRLRSKDAQMQEGGHFRSYTGHVSKHICAERVSVMHAEGTGVQ